MCDNNDKTNSIKKITLNNDWQFRQLGDTHWKTANVPGCIHSDLFKNKQIPDPFFGDNEKQLQWIESKDWEYSCSFTIDSSIQSSGNIDLIFEGLDTYADIFFNKIKLGSTNNMFREWKYDIKTYLTKGNNNLRIVFHSPVNIDSLKAKELKYSLPDSRGFSRKAAYQYGWDWGPRLVTSGIWRPVYIQTWNSFNIEKLNINCTGIRTDKATLSAEFDINSEITQHLKIRIIDSETEIVYSKYNIDLIAGENHFGWGFSINNPELWWTNGLGKPNLYNLNIEIETSDYTHTINKSIGLRTIQLLQKPDSVGSSFEFILNGIPVFIKGANYIPMDNFLANVSQDRYEELISDAVEANINMLRVWGGGIYENDIFYDLCDENGILVWQDFMFACNMYPGDEDFIENVKEEAKLNIVRLQEHPCIALWCGNNEVDNGWNDWGWQKQFNYSHSDSTEIYNNYKKLFNNVLPNLINLYSPKTPYWPSSPKWGWGHNQSKTEGDSHYWGVWWGKESFNEYENNVGRFMSEYGFQAYPDMKTIKQFTNTDDRNLNSEAIKNHQKHPIGNKTIIEYMERNYPIPNDFETFVYLSQIVQAKGITKAIEVHRRTKPYCMGTLYWQLNDCWPAISWSSLDYNLRWKALHYHIKKTYNNIIISTEINNDSICVYVVSDSIKDFKANLVFNTMNFEGGEIETDSSQITIKGNTSKIYHTYNIEDLLTDSLKFNHFINISLIANNKTIAEKNKFLCMPKYLELKDANINIEIDRLNETYEITLTSQVLVKDLFLELNDTDLHLSDNYFDLIPGKAKKVYIYSREAISNLESKIKLTQLNSLLINNRKEVVSIEDK